MSVGTSAVDIWRIALGNEREYVKRVDWSEIRENPFEGIRARFGPGKYLVRFRAANGTYRGSKTIKVAADSPNGTPGGTPGSTPVFSDHQFMRDILVAMIAKQTPAPPPPPLDLAGLAAILSALRPAPAPDAASMLTAVVTAVGQLKPSEITNPFTTAKSIIELGMSIKGDGGDKEDNIYGVIRDVGKEVISRIQLPPAGPIPAETMVSAAPSPVPAQLEPVVNPAEAAPVNTADPTVVANLIRKAIGELKIQASKGQDVELVLDWIFGNQEVSHWAVIIGVVRQGATFENLLQFDPAIAGVPELATWFKMLYDGISAEIFQPVDSGGQSRDVANPASNGSSSQAGQPESGNPKPSE
jgi:hypothetical protein